MYRKLTHFFYSMRFGQKLFLILVLFTLIPLLAIQQITMHFYETRMLNTASDSSHSIVSANNLALDMLFNNIETTSLLMIDNQFYYDIFSNLDNFTVSDYLRYDRLITTELAKQFNSQSDVYETYLYCSKWLFGVNTDLMPMTIQNFQQADFDLLAKNAKGYPLWIGGYDYGIRTQNSYLMKKESYQTQYPITMLREMHFQYTNAGNYQRLSSNIEKPILVVHILEENIRKLYQNSIPYTGSLYVIADNNGTIISSDNDYFSIGTELPQNMISHIGKSGYITYKLNEKEYLFCYDTLTDRGFFSFSLIPIEDLTAKTVFETRRFLWICVLILIFLAIFIAFILSRTISRPIAALTKAAMRISQSDFSANTPVPESCDFKLLTESFNHMEHEISRLIHENYEIALREKETQLMALTIQINPHFLYNTLNTINMLAIQNEDEETAELIVSLSEMLQYTCKDSSDQAPISDEIEWVSNYLFLMSKRYNGLFRTVMDIDEDLIDCKIPKFILQPLVENCILHGFSDMQKEGVLTLSISKDENSNLTNQKSICIEIKDNGKGMDEFELEKYIHAICIDGHIGISNVHHRLSLIYGENYKIHVSSTLKIGTCIQIHLPANY